LKKWQSIGRLFIPFVTEILQIGAIQGSPEYNLGVRRNALMNEGKLQRRYCNQNVLMLPCKLHSDNESGAGIEGK